MATDNACGSNHLVLLWFIFLWRLAGMFWILDSVLVDISFRGVPFWKFYFSVIDRGWSFPLGTGSRYIEETVLLILMLSLFL